MLSFSRRPVGPRLGTALFLALSLGFAGAPPLAAQDAPRDCRCVDANGEPIANCVCVRSFGADGMERFSFQMPRARIGVSLESDARGALVTEVLEDSPADEAGIREGDVITRVDGQLLLSPLGDPDREQRIPSGEGAGVERLMAVALDWEPGEDVEIEVLRGGETLALTAEAEEAPGGAVAVRAFGRGPGEVRVFAPDGFDFDFDDSNFRELRLHIDSMRAIEIPRMQARAFQTDSLARAMVFRAGGGCAVSGRGFTFIGNDCVEGVRLVELNPDLGDYFGASEGVLVTQVDEASELGLRAGDVILSIGGRAVEETADVARILASYEAGEDVALRVLRQGTETEVTGRRR